MNKRLYSVEYRQKGNPYGLTVKSRIFKAFSFTEALHASFDYSDKLKKPLTWKKISSVETGEGFTLEEFRNDLTLALPNDR